MGEVAAALLGAAALEEDADGALEAFGSALGGREQLLLELAEGELDCMSVLPLYARFLCGPAPAAFSRSATHGRPR